MKVGVFSNSISNKGGGIAYYLKEQYKSLHSSLDYEILTLCDGDTGKDEYPELHFKAFQKQPWNGFKFGYSREMQSFLKQKRDYDVLHINSIWGYSHLAGFNYAEKYRIPYLLSTHGMFASEALKVSRFKKQIMSKLFISKSLQSCNCVHVTTLNEYENVRRFGATCPIAIVPIGIDLSLYQEKTDETEIFDKWPELKGKRILLFLSRVDPIKSVENLILAWSRLKDKFKDWHLVIAGDGNQQYLSELVQIVDKKNINHRVTFTGSVYGKDKNALFSMCDLFVLPTKTENFGIVIPEAFAFKKPVITTKGAPWGEIEEHNCGWWIDYGVDPLIKSLDTALSLNKSSLEEMGKNGLTLVKQKYSWEQISNQMIQLFQWVKNKEITRPEFVKID
ncbi:glycosyltransferase [Maribellus mangrovi]|uniref:glycosyltransferase n=1 Tax=Maribellus mangrovi TaxID=3133146 RepID=UPI0030ECEA1C